MENKELENKLNILLKDGTDLLRKYYNLNCQIIINFNGIKITSDEVFIPNKEFSNDDKLKRINKYIKEQESYYFNNCTDPFIDNQWSTISNHFNEINKIINEDKNEKS